ncbi:MAG TPA: VIT domain-containing protein [Fimbriimonas sp.]|nr:VIT domain-containing protein [Fimbriimonas sp.]
MMRTSALAMMAAAACLGYSQHVEDVYKRDDLGPFKLKGVHVESTVIGPIVRTSTLLTYDNPYKTQTEACLNFSLPEAAALSGFAYYYGDEYVRGQLMDKAKAWFIYTAITSRDRDPGIMDQESPTSYHCQIYPLKVGFDLRIRLYTVGFLQPSKDVLRLPKPEVPVSAGYFDRQSGLGALDWNVRSTMSEEARKEGDDYTVPLPEEPVRAVAQRFKDGRVYVSGLMHVAKEDSGRSPTFAVLRQAKVVDLDDHTIAFMGWLRRNKKIAVRYHGQRVTVLPEKIGAGTDTARLWAQQVLANSTWRHGRDVLRFSLKYGVPSKLTALLAVPSSEMKLFREKEKHWQRESAEQRRRELERAREKRDWSQNRNQNWQSSGGGDPEIRIQIPGARKVQALLPDGRVLDLTFENGEWAGNFEIPAAVPEGAYPVQVVAHMPDGSIVTRSWTYRVDRTAPTGTYKFVTDGGKLLLEVRSEKGLSEVAAFCQDGTKWLLNEVAPGLYRGEAPRERSFTIVLKDQASNKGEIVCSLPR